MRAGLREQLQPDATGWMAHRRPFEFEDGFASDAFRFLNGNPEHSCVAGRPFRSKRHLIGVDLWRGFVDGVYAAISCEKDGKKENEKRDAGNKSHAELGCEWRGDEDREQQASSCES